MRSITVVLGAAMLLWLPPRAAEAQNYQEATGPYGQIAFAWGWSNTDSRFTLPPTTDTGTMIGLSFTGGYRISTWIGVDAEFIWVGGGDLLSFGEKFADASMLAITANVKVYPLAYSPDLIPQWIQPYVVMGIGSGLAQYTPTPELRMEFGATNVNIFMGRFGGGIEILLTGHWGTYVDGSYYVASDEVFNGAGTLRFGILYNF